MEDSGQPFDVALAVTRAGNVFTTHTPVSAGFDRFAPALIEQYLGAYAEKKLGITRHELLAMGRQNPNDPSEPFNMAYLAIRGSGAVNGVSRLHGEVSRHLFAPLFPHWPDADVPVGHVTNGVHMPTWDSAAADDLWTDACGKDRWLKPTDNLEQDIRRISDARLWQFRTAASTSLIDYARQRLARHYAAAGASSETVEEMRHLFDPHVLTLGFARRFATYKRPNLLLHDPGATAAPVVESAASGTTHPGRQGPSRGRGGTGADPAMGPLHSPARGPSACDLPQRLRHAVDRAPGARAWMSGSTRLVGRGRRVGRAA